ncbi:MAG: hypothetical protein HXY44_05680 [Syntrophaceae bacterium]|nr:hypothetical protein [Syntrophaceae bacterium]
MDKLDQEEKRYRVLLLGIGENSKQEIDSFCDQLSKNYGIPLPVLKKIVGRCPIILKKNLSLKKAELLGRTLKAFGGNVSIEERRDDPPILLEFQDLVPHQLALESSYLRKAPGGAWSIIGRIKNISDEMLTDIWALAQFFDVFGEFVAFEESPLPINPLPPEEGSPFKVIFEGEATIRKISIAFKNALGQPIPAVDKRKKREWIEVELTQADEHFLSIPERPPAMEQRAEGPKFSEEETPTGAEKSDGLPIEEFSQEISPLRLEEDFIEKGMAIAEPDLKISPKLSDENEWQKQEAPMSPLKLESFETSSLPASEGSVEPREEEKGLPDLEPSSIEKEVPKESILHHSVFKEATHLLETISEKSIREEKPSPFPWLEDFRRSVEIYYQRLPNIFANWFKECQKEGSFINSIHALLTLLAYSRFDQGNQPVQALENTQRVVRIILQRDISADDIPPLEGTTFISGEGWKDLFHRALPKLHQIGNAILEKRRWKAFDLERLLQVIPQMGHQNSRLAIDLMHELFTELIEIDFSNTPVVIEERLYRVASRLGILNPHFDTSQRAPSTGDIKIQSFAQMAFPQNPLMIEEPMTLMAMEEDQGGHCFPTQPQCEGCLFETFCPRLHLQFDPSEKGMRK